MSHICNDMTRVWLCGATVFGASFTAPQLYETNLPPDHPAIRYRADPSEDRVAQLAEELERGESSLEFDAQLSYLPSLLARLGVTSESQTLVFSKTSVQESRISPRTPRAIYFGDDVAVAFIPGSDNLELAAVDPGKGTVFYSLDARNTGKPRLVRAEGCLHCHQGPATLGVPGIYVGSVATRPSGRADFRLGSIVTDHRTPFPDRWGGWYVDGTTGETHRGNAVSTDPEFTSSVPALRFDAKSYPAASSDIVALMTLEHQTQMINLLTRLSWEARIDSKGPDAPGLSARIEEVVRYMLFLDERPLSAPIRGASAFSETFPRRGPRDRKGRSLRDFDLEKRLFRYPLSYMVYGRQIQALPEGIRDRLFRRLHETLQSDAVAAEDRRAILEILADTRPEKGEP
jgi:hypothetical protein